MRIVTSIVEIIVLMESVAEMRVEQLEVPQTQGRPTSTLYV